MKCRDYMLKRYVYLFIVVSLFSSYSLSMEQRKRKGESNPTMQPLPKRVAAEKDAEDINCNNKITCTPTYILADIWDVKDMKFNPEGDKIAIIGSDSKLITIWDVYNKKTVSSLKAYSEEFTCLEWCVENSIDYIITCSKDLMLQLWNPSTGECMSNTLMALDESYHAPIISMQISKKNLLKALLRNAQGQSIVGESFLTNEDGKKITYFNQDSLGSAVYYSSLHPLGNLVCLATERGEVQLFASKVQGGAQDENNVLFERIFTYVLKAGERLISVKFLDKNKTILLFATLKNESNQYYTDVILINEQNVTRERYTSVIDYNEQTQTFLSLGNRERPNRKKLLEYCFLDGEKAKAKKVLNSEKVIQSALYNSSGTQILITTDDDQIVLSKMGNDWVTSYTTRLNAHIILHPTRHDMFVVMSNEEYFEGIGTLATMPELYEITDSSDLTEEN